MENLKIEYLSADDLVPYENNARRHHDEDVDAIARSIEKFGFDDPIGIWKENIIIEGHGRLLAAKKLGLKKIPVIRLDHLTDEERRAYALAHNKTAELSDWNPEALKLELEEIEEIEMSDFGFVENATTFDSLDNYFENSEPKEKEKKRYQCPNCGEWIEVDE